MIPDQPTLQARGITRTFGTGTVMTTALRDINLELERGQISMLMGPSGSGKSTLLAILSGLLPPDRGSVLALGQDIWQMSDREREQFRLRYCGFVFQAYNLFPALTGREQLEIVLRWGGGATARDARRLADEMLSLLDLGKKGHLRPSQMSGGEKQRVAVGRALIKDPAFCFADEPTSALDWAHGEQVVELLRSAAHDRGATILIVSHDARIVPYVDQVMRIEDGCLVDSVPASGLELRSYP